MLSIFPSFATDSRTTFSHVSQQLINSFQFHSRYFKSTAVKDFTPVIISVLCSFPNLKLRCLCQYLHHCHLLCTLLHPNYLQFAKAFFFSCLVTLILKNLPHDFPSVLLHSFSSTETFMSYTLLQKIPIFDHKTKEIHTILTFPPKFPPILISYAYLLT